MTRSSSHAPHPAGRLPLLVGVAVLVAACGGGAAVTLAPSAVPAPSETAAASVAVTTIPGATLPPMTAEPPLTAPPVTEAPVTAPPTTAPVTDPPATPPPPSVAPGVGVQLQIGDEQLMTVLAAEQWPGTTSVKPAKGKAFFTVSIRIDAIATTSWDSADFKLRDAAGKSYSWRVGRSPHLYDGANMTSGQNYVGWITYEVPKASVSELTLIYKPAFLSGTTFKVPLS